MEFVPESALAAEQVSAFFKANTKYTLHIVLEMYLKYEPGSS